MAYHASVNLSLVVFSNNMAYSASALTGSAKKESGDMKTTRLADALGRLPIRFQWTVHNVLAHPFAELLWQMGFPNACDSVHDMTVPTDHDALAAVTNIHGAGAKKRESA